MIANGLPLSVRHSTAGVAELNGPNQTCAAGSLAAVARLRPTETVSRKSPSLTSTLRPALPGHIRNRGVVDAIAGAGHTAISWRGRCIAAANCLCVCRWNYAGAGTE